MYKNSTDPNHLGKSRLLSLPTCMLPKRNHTLIWFNIAPSNKGHECKHDQGFQFKHFDNDQSLFIARFPTDKVNA